MSKTNDSSTIVTKTSSNIFIYDIIQEEIYPNKDILAYTSKPNQYRIPHNYIVKTIFKNNQLKKTITCSIHALNAANLYIQQYYELIATDIEQKNVTKTS
ncbi:12853_t:CDS:2, partial [Racocetra fulgida]